VNIVRLNLDRADPPEQVIDAFREVQAAEQERDRLERQADAYANRVLAGARGEAAQLLEEAEAYRAQVVNEAQGEASRFLAVLAGIRTGARSDPPPSLPRDDGARARRRRSRDPRRRRRRSGGSGVVPYLPLERVAPWHGWHRRGTTTTTGSSN
jgi:membrane protease subunit HflK